MTPAEKENELRLLFGQWLHGAGDEQLLHALTRYADDTDVQHVWQQLLSEAPAVPPALLSDERQQQVVDTVYARLSSSIPALRRHRPVYRIHSWIKYAAAVVLILLASGLAYFLIHRGDPQKSKDAMPVAGTFNVTPGSSNKAVLTLGNGTNILLDSTANGQLAQQTGATVNKPAAGHIAYQKANARLSAEQAPEFNTLHIPNGGTYQVTLSDGTAVWLNAASTITFPVVFSGHERRIAISGEAYLEVRQNAQMPFTVEANGALIDVLGTSFNISAYPGDPTHQVTLLSGKVRLSDGKESTLLKPGQQARFGPDDNTITVKQLENAEDAIAWKSGTFNFNNQELTTVMNQISRWYDVDIRYEGDKPRANILGMMSRNTDLATVLKSLELTSGVHFTLEKGMQKRGTIVVRQ